MQPNSTNGVQASPREMLDSLRLVIEKLENEVNQQGQEIEQLRAERSEYRRMLVDFVKPELLSREEREQLNPNDFKLTIDDLLAVIDDYKE